MTTHPTPSAVEAAEAMMTKEQFTIRRRHLWKDLGDIKVEIECDPSAPHSMKLGLAVRVAVKSGANLSGANLSGANLSGANLSGANLSDEDLRPFKADLWLTLSELKTGAAEALHLIHKLHAGEVDGSIYDGDGDRPCACLVGTIAQAKEVSGEELDHNSSRPAERWFMMIQPGDKPEHETGGGFAARKALEWTMAWCVAHGIEVAQ